MSMNPEGPLVLPSSACWHKDRRRRILTTVVRVMQWQLLFSLCYLLEDPGDVEVEVNDITWSLFQTDEAGRPIAPIGGLHESVLETEPSGREMRA